MPLVPVGQWAHAPPQVAGLPRLQRSGGAQVGLTRTAGCGRSAITLSAQGAVLSDKLPCSGRRLAEKCRLWATAQSCPGGIHTLTAGTR